MLTDGIRLFALDGRGLSWYDTRDEADVCLGSANTYAHIEGAYQIASSIDLTSMTLFWVSSGTGVPWNHLNGHWSDYQALAFENVNYTFLSAWGGDARNGASQAGIWSAVLFNY